MKTTPGMLRAADAQRQIAHESKQPAMTKSDLLVYGQHNWSVSYAHTEDHNGAWQRLVRSYDQRPTVMDGVTGADYVSLPNVQIAVVGSALWCHCGFPQVIMGHKQCASLLSSHIAIDVLDLVRAPWPALFIEIPHGLIFATNDAAELAQIVSVLVLNHGQFDPPRWSYIAFTESSITLWRHGVTTRLLCDATLESSYDTEPYSEHFTSVDARAQALLGRLILGVCLSMSDPTRFKEPGTNNTPAMPGNKRASPLPKTRTYVLKTTTAVDCRAAVTDYARGGASSVPKVQVMVAGHWRHQPHGPGSKLRKLIHISPYWKNNADLPILVKPHRL